jgi:hypothetical protein
MIEYMSSKFMTRLRSLRAKPLHRSQQARPDAHISLLTGRPTCGNPPGQRLIGEVADGLAGAVRVVLTKG